jgi:hypothetical protein
MSPSPPHARSSFLKPSSDVSQFLTVEFEGPMFSLIRTVRETYRATSWIRVGFTVRLKATTKQIIIVQCKIWYITFYGNKQETVGS